MHEVKSVLDVTSTGYLWVAAGAAASNDDAVSITWPLMALGADQLLIPVLKLCQKGMHTKSKKIQRVAVVCLAYVITLTITITILVAITIIVIEIHF